MPDISTLVMLLLLAAAFYFLLIRPQQKRAKQQQEMTKSFSPGVRVMTTSGVLATIKHVGEKQIIVEIAPGVEMTVISQAILKVLGPDDDEFEYADDADESSDADPVVEGSAAPEATEATEAAYESAPEGAVSDPARRDESKN